MTFNSIRFKTSILYTSILCIILVIFSGILFFTIQHILYRDMDERLMLKANEIVNILKSYGELKGAERQPQNMIKQMLGLQDQTRTIIDRLWRSDMRALNLKKDYFAILNRRGQILFRSDNFDGHMAALFKKKFPPSITHAAYADITNDHYMLRTINLPFYYGMRDILVIQVGTPLDSVTRILNELLYFMGAGILFILGLTSFLGSFFARKTLKPVLKVTRIANDISHTDLNMRIGPMEADEEMQHLISSFNAMIGRLEKSFEHINEFSSHVAHELKTPLAIIKGEIELALNEIRDVEEYKRVLKVTLEETDRLVRIIKDLLLLAKLDYSPEVFTFEKLDLVAFFKEIYETCKILTIEKNIELTLSVPPAPAFIKGDVVHLRRLFFNLINNAIKYTPENGKIDIALTPQNETVHVAISDNGIGISEENLARIFNKFFRVHNDDQSAETGSGLGLTIARSIARAHQGSTDVHSRTGQGSTFTVILPLI